MDHKTSGWSSTTSYIFVHVTTLVEMQHHHNRIQSKCWQCCTVRNANGHQGWGARTAPGEIMSDKRYAISPSLMLERLVHRFRAHVFCPRVTRARGAAAEGCERSNCDRDERAILRAIVRQLESSGCDARDGRARVDWFGRCLVRRLIYDGRCAMKGGSTKHRRLRCIMFCRNNRNEFGTSLTDVAHVNDRT